MTVEEVTLYKNTPLQATQAEILQKKNLFWNFFSKIFLSGCSTMRRVWQWMPGFRLFARATENMDKVGLHWAKVQPSRVFRNHWKFVWFLYVFSKTWWTPWTKGGWVQSETNWLRNIMYGARVSGQTLTNNCNLEENCRIWFYTSTLFII